MNRRLHKELQRRGALTDETVWLNAETPESLRFAELVSADDSNPLEPVAVVMANNRPLVYVVKGLQPGVSGENADKALNGIRRKLACRGDAKYMAIFSAGQWYLYTLDLRRDLPEAIHIPDEDDRLFFLEIEAEALTQPDSAESRTRSAKQKAVRDVLFDVLTYVSDEISAPGRALHHRPDDVISLVGRCLFIRFLVDRQIINPDTFPDLYEGTSPGQCFDSPEMAARTCEWLDKTFNGELLPLSHDNFHEFFADLHKADPMAISDLSLILNRAEQRQLSFELYWDFISFAYVPVGLLSEVYEHFAHKLFEDSATKESIYYTPRHIAEYMVEQAFAGLSIEKKSKAKILDPSVGAGVFLVACYRRLVQERWQESGRRPGARQLRNILNNQIFGYDINSWALRLSALSLYLTAIELDPKPTLNADIKFDKLLDNNLIDTRGPDEPFPESIVLGSLMHSPAYHEGIFDLVIGNPPWSAWGNGSGKEKQPLVEQVNQAATELSSSIARRRITDDAFDRQISSYRNPDNVPDLPFVWRATQWAKKDAMIAFALHGRLLLKTSGTGAIARNLLFRAMKVLAVLNAASLDRKIWPGMDQPFCLLFARNVPARNQHRFLHACPSRDQRLADRARFRIDHGSVEPIQINVLEEEPELLRLITMGNAADVSLVRRLNDITKNSQIGNNGRHCLSLHEYWQPSIGLHSGQGFRPAPNQQPRSALFLKEMNAAYLHAKRVDGLAVDGRTLPDFDAETLHTPRTAEIYRTPLVLIQESSRSERPYVRAVISVGKRPIAYTQSFYGYSSREHADPIGVANYLHALVNSDLFAYFSLMNSRLAERRTVFLKDMSKFPMLPYESLTKEERMQFRGLSKDLQRNGASSNWQVLNECVARLYGLHERDAVLMADTLALRLPYAEFRQASEAPVEDAQMLAFIRALEDFLNPGLSLLDSSVACTAVQMPVDSWRFFDVISNPAKTTLDRDKAMESTILALADRSDASRVILELGEGHLRIGMLNQYRYWATSRAMLLGCDILDSHEESLLTEAA